MAGTLNKVIIIGNVGKDPEIRTTNDGKEIASLVVATSESWKDKASGEKKERTEWHRVVIFNEGLVNIIKNYVQKGSKIYVEGSLQTRKWTDQNNQERYSTEIVLQNYNGNITLLDSRKGEYGDSMPSSNKSNNASESNQHDFAHSELDDEIPF